MWLILADSTDPAAAWLAEGLRARSPLPVHWIPGSDLAHVARLESEQGRDGVQFRVHLASGPVIDSRVLRGVVNRITALPPGLAARRDCPDRASVVRHFGSPIWRLLAGFPGPVLNRPTVHGLSGDYRLGSEWAALAKNAGLPLMRWEPPLAPGDTGPEEEPAGWARVAVVGQAVVPLERAPRRLPHGLEAQCLRLAGLAEASVLGIEFMRLGRDQWQFLGADLRPNLALGGQVALDAVALALGLGRPGNHRWLPDRRPGEPPADFPAAAPAGSPAGSRSIVRFRSGM